VLSWTRETHAEKLNTQGRKISIEKLNTTRQKDKPVGFVGGNVFHCSRLSGHLVELGWNRLDKF